MTPTLGTRQVSSVGLATNWRLLTVDNQTHPDSSFDRQKFLYGRLSMCFSSCIFHSCIFHSRIFSAPASSNAGSKQPSASSRILYCGHSTPYRRLVCEVERCTAHSPCRVTWSLADGSGTGGHVVPRVVNCYGHTLSKVDAD